MFGSPGACAFRMKRFNPEGLIHKEVPYFGLRPAGRHANENNVSLKRQPQYRASSLRYGAHHMRAVCK